jgi:DNA recombination protein RmuC
MNTPFLVLILGFIFLALVVLVVLATKKRDNGSAPLMEKLIQQSEKLTQLAEQNKDLRYELDKKLAETHRASQDNFGATTKIMQNISGQSTKVISDLTDRLAKLEETNRQVVNFSAQLQNLQDILKNPKQRGVLGEYFLEETLKNVLPPNSYQMQYPFKDGTIVDAVVFVKEKVIPIDSKFSLDNYNRIITTNDMELREKLEKQFRQDLKIRIDETSKYIKPAENTMEFAFMFIPSEAIYYDLLVNKIGAVTVNTRDLIEYAFKEKKVIIVSPTSFLAYLQTVLQGLRAMQIEEGAKEIKANVEKLGKHILSYEEVLQKLGKSMSTSVNYYNDAYKEFSKLDKDIMKIAGSEKRVEAVLIDRPKIE